ncbi:hypothetical protein BLSTO_04396 [Blastocystis sp. subtype 1]
MNTSMESTMGSGGNLFSLGGDSLHGMRGKELSPSFNGLSRSLGPSGGSFMLTPFTSDYAGPFGGASLATPAARTPGFAPMTPMNPLYLDNSSLMGDYPSDAGYSPLPASPYYNEDLSPRRLFPSPSSTNSRLLMTCSSARPLTRSTDAPPLQRSLSMTSNASLKPMASSMTGSMAPSMTTPMTGSMTSSMTTPMTSSMTSSMTGSMTAPMTSSMTSSMTAPMTSSMTTPMEMGMAGSTIEYRGQTTFKSKERSKGLAWQTGEVESFRGHIKDMSRDHNGCRTLQQCLDECPQKIVPMIYEEVGNELTELMMDSFGNYLFQKLLDVSSDDQRRDVLNKVKDKIVDASYNVHGTRSVQRLIQVCKEPDMVKTIMDALRGHIADLSSHSNGNHVIQRCLQYMPEQYRIDVFKEVVDSCVDVLTLAICHPQISTHRHGCCVVQRCLDSAPAEYHNLLLDAIVQNSYELICNPFGNYVIQYLIEHGQTEEAERITRCVLGRVSELSCQKYSSNVIEKILSCATTSVRGEIIVEIANSSKLRDLLHDKYANYVIQKALKIGTVEQKKLLLDAIRPYEEELGRSTGGKHILTQLNEITSTATSPRWSKD